MDPFAETPTLVMLQDADLFDAAFFGMNPREAEVMTATSFDAKANRFTVDTSAESLDKTAGLGQVGRVNLEKALRAHDRLGGHIVSGHVDGLGQVTHFAPVGESWELRVAAPRDLAKYLAYKGSITVNGVSLTVNRVSDSADACEFSINLIPHTIENTTLGDLQAGHRVNLEVDMAGCHS